MPSTEELAVQLADLRRAVPTCEELLTTVAIQSWNGRPLLPGSTRCTLLAAPIPLSVLSVAVVFEYGSVPASDTRYWTGTLERGTGPTGFPDLAARTTRSTGPTANGPITPRQAWTWDAAAWSGGDLAAGDLLAVNWTPSGGVPPLVLPALYTIRYRPL